MHSVHGVKIRIVGGAYSKIVLLVGVICIGNICSCFMNNNQNILIEISVLFINN